jgi:LysM repeat protein
MFLTRFVCLAGLSAFILPANFAFAASAPAATPTLSVPGGTYQVYKSVTISDATAGASIYYTVTGVTPTTMSTKYTGPVTVNRNMTLQAIAAVPDGPPGPIATAAYTILPSATPTLSVPGGTYQVFKSVTISDATAGASIYYTVTGVTPTTMSTKYTGPVAVNRNMTLQAIAAVPGGPVSPIASATYTFVPAVAPTLSVAAGNYQDPQTVTISDATSGAQIFYTVSGATPTTSSTLYSGPLTVSNSMTLQAIAAIPGGPVSPIATATYTISPAATPTVSVPGGTYQVYKSVTISDATAGASIYYTVTGVTPTTMSTKYTGPVTVNRNMTLQAIAAVPDGPVSPIASATYTFVPSVAPTLSVAAGTYQDPQTVTISDATAGAQIFYTVTGVTPTTLSTQYTGPLTVSSNMTLQAIAAIPGGPPGPIATATYTILPSATPTLSIPTGVYQGIQSVTMSDATAGASIYYTVTGVTPTTLSTKYSGPVTVSANMTLQAIAAVSGGPVSPIATATYTIVPPSTPIKTPNSSATFFGMSIDHLLEGTPWPDLPIAAIRLWDTDTKWGDLNPTATTYVWQNLDTQINMAQANNSALLYTFGGTPPWALPTNVPIASITRSGGIVTVTTTTPHSLYYNPIQPSTSQSMFTVAGVTDGSFDGTFYLTGTPSADTLTYAQAGTDGASSSGTISAVCGGEYAPSMCAEAPASLSQWDEYVTQLISHLGPGVVQYWELWNEANDPIYWQGDPSTLVAMAEDAQRIIKGVDPAAIILSPTFTGAYETQAECLGSVQYCGTTWLSNWLALGGKSYIDVVGFHGYPGIGLAPEEIQGGVYQVQAAMTQNGVGSLPLWDTESSWRNNTNIPAASDQAGWLARHFLLEESIGVQRTFWYAYDAPTWGTLWTSASGLDEAGEAYAQVAKWLTGTTLSQPCAVLPSDETTFVCSYTRPDGYAAEAIWNTTAEKSVSVSSQFVQYHDLSGVVWPVSGGTVEISTNPILLETSSAF